MHDLIIVGGGAAALSAAAYALGKQLDVAIVAQDVGGKAGTLQQLRGQTDAEYLTGVEAIQSLEREVLAAPQRIVREQVASIAAADGAFQVKTSGGTLQALALIIATGARPIPLDVPGADELLGRGLGYSATTHAHLFAGKTVAVIGTTPRALRGATELARNADRVVLVAPHVGALTTRLGDALRQLPNVETLAGYRVKALNGPFNVTSLVVQHGDDHRWLQVDAAFADLGLIPNSELVRDLVECDPDGYIVVDGRMATSRPGLFAAGDVTTAFGEQMLIAAGDGARAAVSAYDYILAHQLAVA